MSRLDELPPDQRAALSLLLRQRKSYAEVALLLDIPDRAVHDRAHAALAMLAPADARAVPAERRGDVGDYLLGQQSAVADRLRTRTYLGASEPARAWAHAIAAELSPLAETGLPEIPAAVPAAEAAADAAPTPLPPLAAEDTTPASPPPSSRLGGALLLAALAAVVIVAVVLLTGGGSSKHTTTTTAATKTGPKVTAQLALRSPNTASRSIGVVAVLSEKGKRAFYIEAQNLAPTHGFYYAIWLYNSPTSAEALSRGPAVGASGKLAGGAPLPANANQFREMLLTRETATRPTHPGHVVLSGPFTVGS